MSIKHLNTKELGKYIETKGNVKDKKKIESHLNECKECFKMYMSLKEAIFLQKKKVPIPNKIKEFALKKVREQSKSHISIIMRFYKDKVSILAGNQESLHVQALEASYSFRGENEGHISISRNIKGREIITIINAIDKNNVSLAIKLGKKEKLTAIAIVEGQEIEKINLVKQSMFRSKFEKNSEILISFTKKKKEIFSISLKMEDENNG